MSKNDTLCQNGDKMINMKYLPQWNDDNMPSLSDNNPMEEDKRLLPDEQPLDANQIDDFDNFKAVQVLDRYGNIIGERFEPAIRKRKPKKNNNEYEIQSW